MTELYFELLHEIIELQSAKIQLMKLLFPTSPTTNQQNPLAKKLFSKFDDHDKHIKDILSRAKSTLEAYAISNTRIVTEQMANHPRQAMDAEKKAVEIVGVLSQRINELRSLKEQLKKEALGLQKKEIPN